MKKNPWALMALLVMVLIPVVACKATQNRQVGMDINNSFETAVISVETGLFNWPKTVAEAASVAVSETPVGLMGPGPQGIPVGSCYFHTGAALTHNASNYATLLVQKRTAGGSPTTIAQLSTNVTDWTIFTNVPIPLAAPIEYVSPGDAVTFSITKTGTGVSVPIGQLACFTNIN